MRGHTKLLKILSILSLLTLEQKVIADNYDPIKFELDKYRDVRGVADVYGGSGRIDIDTMALIYLYSF